MKEESFPPDYKELEISRKYQWWYWLSRLTEVFAYVCIFIAWSGNGHDRIYIELQGMRFGGLGYCKS